MDSERTAEQAAVAARNAELLKPPVFQIVQHTGSGVHQCHIVDMADQFIRQGIARPVQTAH
jgi:hypothetical protein